MPSILPIALLAFAASAYAATYEVGTDQAYTSIGAVPWESLNAGDTVRIHWRATPYREKWVINRSGTQSSPITVIGVPGTDGSLPVISGENATTRSALSYWGRQRSVIKVGGASVPGDASANWIVIENLEVISGREPYSYTSPSGVTESYTSTAASIFIETADHVTVRNCVIRDSSNGLFVAYNPSSNIVVSGCYIYGNGRSGSVYEHNVYTETRGITFEYNRFGPLRAGCPGNNLKDRSAGTVVRYNWIEGGNRQLDLVESADFSEIRDDPAYRTTLVYGNVLIEPVGDGNRQMIHYGGDNGDESLYRKGKLYLYGNTLVSQRTDRTVMARLSSDGESADVRDNIIYTTAAGTTVALLEDVGVLAFTGNWLKPGYINSVTGAGTVTASGNLTGSAPGFSDEAGQDFHPAAGSPCIGAAVALPAAVLPSNDVIRQYVSHRQSVARADVQDIGAFSRTISGGGAPTVSTATATPATVVATTTALAATASDDGGEASLTYTWTAVPATVSFSVNGSNASKASVATFAAAGSYTLVLTVRDAGGQTASRSVAVTVQQTASSVSATPAVVTIAPGSSVALSGSVRDQFGAGIAGAEVDWSVDAGHPGTVAADGTYTATAVAGDALVRATSGALSAVVLVHVNAARTAVGNGTSTSSGSGDDGACGGGAMGVLLLATIGFGLRRRT